MKAAVSHYETANLKYRFTLIGHSEGWCEIMSFDPLKALEAYDYLRGSARSINKVNKRSTVMRIAFMRPIHNKP